MDEAAHRLADDGFTCPMNTPAATLPCIAYAGLAWIRLQGLHLHAQWSALGDSRAQHVSCGQVAQAVILFQLWGLSPLATARRSCTAKL